MKKSQYLIFAIFVGIQSFLLQLVDQVIGTHLVSGGHSGFVFIAFQGWALYFLLGSSVKGAVKGFCGYVLGILFAVIMIGMSAILPDLKLLTVPLVALIVVPFMMYFEFAPWCISNVAVFFVGAGAFFGVNSYVEGFQNVAVRRDCTSILYIRAAVRLDEHRVSEMAGRQDFERFCSLIPDRYRVRKE